MAGRCNFAGRRNRSSAGCLASLRLGGAEPAASPRRSAGERHSQPAGACFSLLGVPASRRRAACRSCQNSGLFVLFSLFVSGRRLRESRSVVLCLLSIICPPLAGV